MVSKYFLWLPVAAGLALLAGCNEGNLTIHQLPDTDQGYFGQPGNFALQVSAEDGTPVEAYQMGTESITPPAAGGKFPSFKQAIESEHRQAVSVFLKLKIDTAVGVLAVRCESKYGRSVVCQTDVIATNTTWAWYYATGPLQTKSLPTYVRQNNLNDSWAYYRHFRNLYGNDYTYECVPAIATTPLTLGSERLKPWRLADGTLVRALIGPEDSAVTDTSGGLRIRVRQAGFAKDTGFLGAVVEYRLVDGTRKTLKLNRILPKP